MERPSCSLWGQLVDIRLYSLRLYFNPRKYNVLLPSFITFKQVSLPPNHNNFIPIGAQPRAYKY